MFCNRWRFENFFSFDKNIFVFSHLPTLSFKKNGFWLFHQEQMFFFFFFRYNFIPYIYIYIYSFFLFFLFFFPRSIFFPFASPLLFSSLSLLFFNFERETKQFWRNIWKKYMKLFGKNFIKCIKTKLSEFVRSFFVVVIRSSGNPLCYSFDS